MTTPKSSSPTWPRWCWNSPPGALSDPHGLPWLDPPPAAAFAQAQDLLKRLEAIDEDGTHHDHGQGTW